MLIDECIVVATDVAGLVTRGPELLLGDTLLFGSIGFGQLRVELRRALERRQRTAGPDALDVGRRVGGACSAAGQESGGDPRWQSTVHALHGARILAWIGRRRLPGWAVSDSYPAAGSPSRTCLAACGCGSSRPAGRSSPSTVQWRRARRPAPAFR